ncbi:MAG: YgiQ family radical SAM protein [Oscillospiraceae bacterium]|nr:YgiQ family radical SAM protein [Oscillospiraceae bacterium]MBQ4539107.1 YgiQ family radical SAM protein [Oscillospiraceae bacterium]
MNRFLPINKQDMAERGWEEADFVCVTGDAYVDHPSFGIAIISRLLERLGYRVAMLAQPDLNDPNAFKRFGRPRLAFMITAGNIDSMVSNYSVAKRRRDHDAYSPTNSQNKRPDYAATVYSRAAKKAYPDCPVILGGIEASLRRFAHYDYWADKVFPSVLVDSGADMISYGMGELQTEQIASRLAAGEPIENLTDIRGTVCYVTADQIPMGTVSCPSFEKVASDKSAFIRAFKQQLDEQDSVYGKPLLQKHGDKYVLQNPPMPTLTREQLDDVFTLQFMRAYHPVYESMGGVKAIEEVEFSIMHNRGCFGHCNFCSITMHQGRKVVSRSIDSVVTEAESFVKNPRFKGYIHDVGGPTADFRYPSCSKQEKLGMCKDKKCLGSPSCPAVKADHSEYLALLRRLRAIKGIKKVFVRSGLRFDYIMLDKDDTFLKELVEHHVSGQLKVAPEHCSNNVLDMMGKPHVEVFERFAKKFYQCTKAIGKEQYLVPYLMSSHPGSTIKDAVELALFLKKHRMRPEQVQDFYPTPGTISTCMFYTGIDPMTGKEVYVPKTDREKQRQRALLQYFRPENRRIVIEALEEIHRTDLIGSGPECLVAPDREYIKKQTEKRLAAQNDKRGKPVRGKKPVPAKGGKRR